MRNLFRGVFSILCLFAAAGSAQDVNVRRVTPHVTVFNMTNMGGYTNITVVRSQKGLVVIETECTPYIASKIKEAAEKELERDDWAYVINTHGHLHHAGGNAAFKNTQVIGPKAMRLGWLKDRLSTPEGREQYCKDIGVRQGLTSLRGLVATDKPTPDQKQELLRRIGFMEEVEREILAGFEVVEPTITVDDRYALDLGDVHLEVIYWGDGIYHSSIFVHVVEDGLLVGMGMSGTWVPDFYGKLTLDGIRRAVGLMDEFRKEDRHIRLMIGVHGAGFTKSVEYFRPRQEYLADLLDGLIQAQEQGLSLEQVKEAFSFDRRYARFRKDFREPKNLEEVHQANIEKIWKLIVEEQSAQDI
jgi:glyoxylase-like metal-dependent hydrolase (beta-lactamase superfamily II)